MIGVMAVDPGLHTGVALGTFCTDGGLTVNERVSEALSRDAARSFEVVLDEKDGRAAELSAAVVIAQEWEQFVYDCTLLPSGSASGVPVAATAVCDAGCRLVMEDWILRPGQMKSSERAALYPVRIASAVEGLLYGRLNGEHEGVAVSGRVDGRVRVPVYQTPTQAKRFATDARLRRYGLWARGSDHERDAYRHLCTFLASLP